MNKNAFTLIELLGVITILAIIAVISTPIIQSIITESKTKACQEQVTIIENAAKKWHTETTTIDIDLINTTCNDICYTTIVGIDSLKWGGYLPSSIKNPKTNNEFGGTVSITCSCKNDTPIFTYTYDSTVCN